MLRLPLGVARPKLGAGKAQAAETDIRVIEDVARGGLQEEAILLVKRHPLGGGHIRGPTDGTTDHRPGPPCAWGCTK